MDDKNVPSSSYSYQLGSMLRRNGSKIIKWGIALAFISIVIWLLVSIMSIENTENETLGTLTSSIAGAIGHRNCRSKQGCGPKCPFVKSNDPRVIAKNKIDEMSKANDMIQSEFKDAEMQMSDLIEHYPNVDLKSILETKSRCASQAQSILIQAKNIYEKDANDKTVNTTVVKAMNSITALEAALDVNMNIFILASLLTQSKIMLSNITGVAAMDQSKIDKYDEKTTMASAHLSNLEGVYKKLIQLTGNTEAMEGDYTKSMREVVDSNTGLEALIDAMIKLINMAKESGSGVSSAYMKYNLIHETHSYMMNKVNTFSNALPAQLSSEDVTRLIDSGDYNTALLKTALEPEITANHMKFAKERSSFDSGGGVPSVRDDDNDIVPWVGIFGRPTYRKTDGTSIEESGVALKSMPSQNPSDVMRTKTPRLTLV